MAVGMALKFVWQKVWQFFLKYIYYVPRNVLRKYAGKMFTECCNDPVLDKGFKFQANVCSGCVLIMFRCMQCLMISMNLSHIVIVNICSYDYCCSINRISKSKAMSLFKHANLN